MAENGVGFGDGLREIDTGSRRVGDRRQDRQRDVCGFIALLRIRLGGRERDSVGRFIACEGDVELQAVGGVPIAPEVRDERDGAVRRNGDFGRDERSGDDGGGVAGPAVEDISGGWSGSECGGARRVATGKRNGSRCAGCAAIHGDRAAVAGCCGQSNRERVRVGVVGVALAERGFGVRAVETHGVEFRVPGNLVRRQHDVVEAESVVGALEGDSVAGGVVGTRPSCSLDFAANHAFASGGQCANSRAGAGLGDVPAVADDAEGLRFRGGILVENGRGRRKLPRKNFHVVEMLVCRTCVQVPRVPEPAENAGLVVACVMFNADAVLFPVLAEKALALVVHGRLYGKLD